ncbi:ceramide glucosyltransferase [bacterium]|nr:ceramide glucosyltransferase [bacterium]
MKPLKGADEGLEENLRSFFLQTHPDYELLFCVADWDDPAVPIVENLIRQFPLVSAKLLQGLAPEKLNPKVQNMLPAYAAARHDLLLISDSNTRVPSDYLEQMNRLMGEGVGAVSSIVAGRNARGLGAWLDAAYLNTAVARWMALANVFSHPCLSGKAMLLRRSVMRRFGGLKNLSRYIAEDYMAGQAVRHLGLTVDITQAPIDQHLGECSFTAFWRRHVRWGRIRRAQSPPGFFIEPFFNVWTSGLCGAFAVSALTGFSAPLFFGTHFTLWAAADAWVNHRLLGEWDVRHFLAWFARELLALPQWIHTALGQSVYWRGARIRLLEGGLVAETP